jgi:cell division protease FtsH
VPIVILVGWFMMVRKLLNKEEKPQARRRPDRSVRLDDVVLRQKQEVTEVVEFLNSPQRFLEAGATLPRGLLFVGPSGTGKTLMAKAIASEAGCNFISASASEFIEVYVGRGPARIRGLYAEARANAPCVVFLDELDALGSRESRSGASDEYVATLTQLLTELDGVSGSVKVDGVVTIAATNRKEALDPAILRPGRFDRQVYFGLPEEPERLAILDLEVAKRSLAVAEPAALGLIAANAEGCSGADLVNVINEATLLRLREPNAAALTTDHLLTALQRVKALKPKSQLFNFLGIPPRGFQYASGAMG